MCWLAVGSQIIVGLLFLPQWVAACLFNSDRFMFLTFLCLLSTGGIESSVSLILLEFGLHYEIRSPFRIAIISACCKCLERKTAMQSYFFQFHAVIEEFRDFAFGLMD